MGMFDKELEGLKGDERTRKRKRLHMAKTRAGKKTEVKRYKIKVRLEPSSKQAEFLRYFADCSTRLYGLMVNMWKEHGSPPKQKEDIWKQFRAVFNIMKKLPEFEVFSPSFQVVFHLGYSMSLDTRKHVREGLKAT